jgi:hypothetical protein
MSIKPKTKPLVSKSDKVLHPRVRKEHMQPIIEVVLKVEGQGRFEDNMLEGSIALGLNKDRHPPNRGHVGVADGVHVATNELEVRANSLYLDIHHIDPMMICRGLSITIPNGLKGVTILVNLPKFTNFPNEDLATHVERFVEVLIIILVIDHDHYFIWFPSILADFSYA